jgi:DNA replication protein DnaC
MRSPEITTRTSQQDCRTSPNCYSRSLRIKMDSALNLGYDEWPNFLGNRPMVEALLSRLRHYCHTVRIDGPSLRELQG